MNISEIDSNQYSSKTMKLMIKFLFGIHCNEKNIFFVKEITDFPNELKAITAYHAKRFNFKHYMISFTSYLFSQSLYLCFSFIKKGKILFKIERF